MTYTIRITNIRHLKFQQNYVKPLGNYREKRYNCKTFSCL